MQSLYYSGPVPDFQMMTGWPQSGHDVGISRAHVPQHLGQAPNATQGAPRAFGNQRKSYYSHDDSDHEYESDVSLKAEEGESGGRMVSDRVGEEASEKSNGPLSKLLKKILDAESDKSRTKQQRVPKQTKGDDPPGFLCSDG